MLVWVPCPKTLDRWIAKHDIWSALSFLCVVETLCPRTEISSWTFFFIFGGGKEAFNLVTLVFKWLRMIVVLQSAGAYLKSPSFGSRILSYFELGSESTWSKKGPHFSQSYIKKNLTDQATAALSYHAYAEFCQHWWFVFRNLRFLTWWKKKWKMLSINILFLESIIKWLSMSALTAFLHYNNCNWTECNSVAITCRSECFCSPITSKDGCSKP